MQFNQNHYSQKLNIINSCYYLILFTFFSFIIFKPFQAKAEFFFTQDSIDLNHNSKIELNDAILALKILSNSNNLNVKSDDSSLIENINLINVLEILQILSGLNKSNIYKAGIFSIQESSGNTQTQVPVSIGYSFEKGKVPAEKTLYAYTGNNRLRSYENEIPVQMSDVELYDDGSVKNAVINFILPQINSNEIQTFELVPLDKPLNVKHITLENVIDSGFNARIDLVQNGKTIFASTQKFISNNSVQMIFSGPICSKWKLSGSFIDISGILQPINVSFEIIAYKGCDRIRVDACIQNQGTSATGQLFVNYDLTMSVGNFKFVQKNASLYPFSNWMKVMWWGQQPLIEIIDGAFDPFLEKHIVNTIITNTSDTVLSDIPISFGHVFKKGDIKPEHSLTVSLDELTQIPVQLDRKAFHNDGSLRHGVINIIMPDIPVNSSKTINLIVKNTKANETQSIIDLSELLQTTYDTKLSIIIDGIEYMAQAKECLQNNQVKTWLSGSLVKEWHVTAKLKTKDNIVHPHLFAYFYIRAFSESSWVRTSVVIENNWTYVDNPSNIICDITISTENQTVYQKSDFVHYHHARWRKKFWQNLSSSTVIDQQPVNIKHDITYLMQTKAIPNFDPDLIGNIPESELQNTYTYWLNHNAPMSSGFINNYSYGYEMWPVLKWTGQYLLSMDNRVKQAIIGNAELAGSFPLHFRDSKTMLPVSINDYPYCTTHWKDNINPETALSEAPVKCSDGSFCDTPHLIDPARKPAYTFIPYLVTGDYYFLEELHFWANFCMLHDIPSEREFSKGIIKGDLGDMAFSIRTIGQAAYITPEDHPLQLYFKNKLFENINYYHQTFLNENYNPLGIATLNNTKSIVQKDDYFTWALGYISDLGFTSIYPILEWKTNFSVLRMTGGDDFCWIFATNPNLQISDTATGTRYSTIKEVYENSKSFALLDDGGFQCNSHELADYLKNNGDITYGKIGELIGKPWASSQPAMLQPALASAVDINTNRAHSAWDQYMARSVIPDYAGSGYPNYDIVPRRYQFGFIDQDNDGIIDGFDECPDTPLNSTVNIIGCLQKDSDNDGVFDLYDACPNSPQQASVNAIGCNISDQEEPDLDSDNDGVADDIDQCPDTPEGVIVDTDGCPEENKPKIYEVGPDKKYTGIIDCPTYDLKAGDQIHVYYKPEPYYEKFLLHGEGSEETPIILKGIADEYGNMPVLDGTNASSQKDISIWNEDRQIIKIGQANDKLSDYIIVEGFELRNANNTNKFIDTKENEKQYLENACGIRVEYGKHIIIRNCNIYSNGNGIQTGATDNQMILLIEHCNINNNGVCSWMNSYIHNLYLSGENNSEITVQYCKIGNLLSNGQQVKSRAHNIIFRYNWVEGGRNSQLDLVEDAANMETVESDAYVYGNVIIKPDPAENSSMIHFGGDQPDTNRRGTLFFFNNTCIVNDTKTWGTRRIFNVTGERPEIKAYNNIFYMNSSTSYQIIEGSTKLSGENNWISQQIKDDNELLINSLFGETPGFVNLQEYDFHLTNDSQCIDKGVRNALINTYPLDVQIVMFLEFETRKAINGFIDIGAFEYGLYLADEDNDGIPDEIDQCPETPSGTNVNSKGCPAIDSDNDGVIDEFDLCPETPDNSYVDINGCPDSDNDGVIDLNDLCPDTPENTTTDENGCPDSDNDGVIDLDDLCPDTPLNINVDSNGCPDNDNDGVNDPDDKCPYTPIDQKVDSVGCPVPDNVRIFNVGPGWPYERIIDCPIHDLSAGDEIHVHYRENPYFEKIDIFASGTIDQPVKIIGICDKSGSKPILDGKNAVKTSNSATTNDERQIIKIGQAEQNASYIIIDGFEIRNANNTNSFINSSGNAQAYNDNASAVRVENGSNIVIRNCSIHDNGNGIQTGKDTHNVLIESCHIYQNGVCSWENSYIHNMYLSGRNGNTITVQYCRIGELLSQGQQVKSRAEKFIFRYNWIEGGRNAQLDLVEDYEVSEIMSYDAYVYGNIIVKPDQSDNSVMIHFGGDQPDTNRMGTLYFYNNTCIVKDTKTWGARRIFKITKDKANIIANNNIFYLAAPVTYELFSGFENISGTNNWISDSITNIALLNNSIVSDSPNFVNLSLDNYNLNSESKCIDSASNESIPENFEPVYQYKRDLEFYDRIIIGDTIDIGAFEQGIPDILVQRQWPNTKWPDNGLYVSQTGIDSESCGTEDGPCRSIQHALSKLTGESKQTIYVHPGTYVENRIYMKNNTRLLGIEGSEKTKIHTEAYNGIFFLGEENNPVINAEISGFDIYGNHDDDSAGRQSGIIRIYHASNIAITNCLIHDAPFDGDCIKVSGYVENLLFDHLVVYNPAHRPAEKAAPFQENIDIFGSMPRRDGRPPVRNIIIRNSWLFHTDKGGHWLLYGKIDVENMLIENNIFGPSAGIDDSKGAGYGPGAVGIGTHENEALEGLTCVNSHTVVRNNIFMFVRGDAPLEIIDSDDIWVYNNLFYNNSGPLVRSAIMFMDHVYNVGKVNLFNNIFQNNQPQRDNIKASMFRNRNDGIPDPFFKDYNLYYDNIKATEISYTDETNSIYPSMAPYHVNLPDPLISENVSLKDIDKIKKCFTLKQQSLIKTKGINPFTLDAYPNWMPSVTDTPIDTFQNSRDSLSSWDLGPFQSGNSQNNTESDSDNDGIIDSEDQCPNTPSGMLVDDLGCFVILPEENIFLSFDSETGNINDGFDNWHYSSPEQNPVYKMTEVGGFYSDPDKDGFQRAFFPYKNINNPSILRYGFLDINTEKPVQGTGCLKFIFTGGAYLDNDIIQYSGEEIFYKSQFESIMASGIYPNATIPLYADEQFYVKFIDSHSQTIEEAQGSDRLSFWAFLPQGSHANSPFPIRTIQYYPYIDTSMNDHYYHWMTNIGMGAWTHIIIDAHPQKNNSGLPVDENGNLIPYESYRVGGHDCPGNGVEYFNRTAAFAIRFKLGELNFPVPIYLDNFSFYKAIQPENDETISNIGVGYNPETHEFDIGFCDKYRGNVCHATYEVRYSFRPITNASYTKTKLCTVAQDPNLDFTYTTDIKGQIKKPVTGYNQLWALLKLDPEDELQLKHGKKIYFAVKDISNRTYPYRDTYDEEMVDVENLGQVKRIDLIKTISYEIFDYN